MASALGTKLTDATAALNAAAEAEIQTTATYIAQLERELARQREPS